VVEVAEIVDAVGDEVERLEDVVEPGDERALRVVVRRRGREHVADLPGVLAEAAQPLGEELEVARVDGGVAHEPRSYHASRAEISRGERRGASHVIRAKAHPSKNPAPSAPMTSTTTTHGGTPCTTEPPPRAMMGRSFEGSVSPRVCGDPTILTYGAGSATGGCEPAGLASVPPGARAGA